MRPNNNQRRGRGRAGRRPNVPARAQTYDSNGPGGRIRGNATQVYEKYVALARDAMAAGDRVLAEGLNQHAEHYFRIINDSTDPEPLRPPAPPKEEVEVSQSQDAAEQPAASSEAPAEATQSEADSQQQPRRSRRRPRPPMGDGETAGEASQAKPTQTADEQAVRSEASEQPSAEDEGLRKMLSATGGASTGGASGGTASSRRRKSNGSAEAKEPEAPDEQPETASEPA